MLDGLFTAVTPKRYTRGTHRTIAPSETLARVRPFLSLFGITRVANITGLDQIGIPVVQAVRPNSRSLSVSQGKGVDLEAARTSAIMESIEQSCAERSALPTRWDSMEQLREHGSVVDVDALAQLERKYDARTRILWCEATSLTNGGRSWVPHELVHLDFTLPLPPGSGYFLGGSNGLASGNQLIEAVIHGLVELLERDALSLFYRMPAAVQMERRFALDAIEDEHCRALLDRYERAGVAVGLWDATSNTGVPTILCGIIDRDTNPFRPIGLARGSGCDPDPAIALCRALTEAAQSRLVRITGTRDDLQKREFDAHRLDRTVESDRAQIAELAPSAVPRDWKRATFATFEQELLYLLERLRSVGLSEVLVVDLSPRDCPVHVARVLAPGLEGSCENPAYRPGARARGEVARCSP